MGRRGRKDTKQKKSGYLYLVQRALQGGRAETTYKDGEFSRRKDAEKFFKKHKKATRIQRVEAETGLTAGTFQPGIPKRIKHRGKTLHKSYAGPHSKKTARALAASLRNDGFESRAHKTSRGYFVYTE